MKYVAFKEQVAELVDNVMTQSVVVQKAIIEALDICANVMADDERAVALSEIAKVKKHMSDVEYRTGIFDEIQRELTDVVICVVALCFDAHPRLIDEYRQGLVWDLDTATCAELGIEFAQEANFDADCWWSHFYILENPQMHVSAVPAILRCIDLRLDSGANEHLRFPTTSDRFKQVLYEADVNFYSAQKLTTEDAQAALEWLKLFSIYLKMTA